MDQWSFTAVFEGIIPHLYLDTRGNPTCGVGFLVVNEFELRKLPWSPDSQAATADYQLVRAAPFGRPAPYYARFCKARLPEPAMRQIFDVKIAELRKQLFGWHLERCPERVQIALLDMTYNLGVAGLNKFAKLRRAVDFRDWPTAAAECRRNGVQQARNMATTELFLRAETPTP